MSRKHNSGGEMIILLLSMFLCLGSLFHVTKTISASNKSANFRLPFTFEEPDLTNRDLEILKSAFWFDDFGYFEWGLNTVSELAEVVGLNHYHAVDHRIDKLLFRRDVSPHYFSFSYEQTPKNYIHSGLDSEIHGFSTYMVNGLLREECVVAAAVHASETGISDYRIVLLWNENDKFSWLLDYFQIVDSSEHYRVLKRKWRHPLKDLVAAIKTKSPYF